MKITLRLSADSCKDAIKQLEEYQKSIKKKMDEVCKRLAEVGAQEAQMRLVLDNGNILAQIDPPTPIENGYKLSMSGEDVYFIEFGTGNAANANGYDVSVPVYPGSWSDGHAQLYSTYKFWWYGGERYEETPAYMPMYYAGKRMREELPKIVKEVFSST